MAEMSEGRAAAEQARLASLLLAQGRAIDRWSLLTTGIALLAVVCGNVSPWVLGCHLAVALLGIVQRYYAFRVGLDAGVFRDWAERWRHGGEPEADLPAFDQALSSLGLGKPAQGAACRSLQARTQGALRLLVRQAAVWALQMALLMVALVLIRHGG